MFGKIFATMFDGSMFGAGFHVIAVWAYAIATKDASQRVELNPKMLAAKLGGDEGMVVEAIQYLSAPDESSRSPECGGRRLIQEGRFLYLVVNGETYQRIRNQEELREQNRLYQQKRREKLKKIHPQEYARTKFKRKTPSNQDMLADTAKDLEERDRIRKTSSVPKDRNPLF